MTHEPSPIREVNWDEVWNVYLTYQDTFRAALGGMHRLGYPVSDAEALDLIADFVTYRLVEALESYRPSAGDLRPWLRVVFRRYAMDRLRRDARRQQLLAQLEDPEPVGAVTVEALDAARLRGLVEGLSDTYREVLRIALGDPGGVRAVARELDITRYRARELYLSALAAVASHFRHGDVWALARQVYAEGRPIAEVAIAAGKGEREVRRLLGVLRDRLADELQEVER